MTNNIGELARKAIELDEASVASPLPFEIEKWLITIKAHCTVISDEPHDKDNNVLAYCIKINVDQDLRPMLLALIAERDGLEARERELEQAIKPFAQKGKDHQTDETRVEIVACDRDGQSWFMDDVKLGDLRHAAALLEKMK